MKRLTYLRARILLLLLGVVFAAGQTVLAWERGAAPSEVLAPALYILVFAGSIFFFIIGGIVAAGLASLLYGLILVDQSGSIGLGAFTGLLFGRMTQYIVYGVIVAAATRYIEARLVKLEMYDQIDDLTGLFNSKFFLEETELEMERSKRYRTLFCVSELSIDRGAFGDASKRRYEKIIKELARKLEQGPRLRFDDPFHRRHTDQPVRVDDGRRDRFFIVLPETPPQGASIFTEKIERATRELLETNGCDPNGHLAARTIAFPEQEEHPGWDASSETLGVLRAEVQEVEAARRILDDTNQS